MRVAVDEKRKRLLERPFAATFGWVEAEDKEEWLNEIIEEVIKVMDIALVENKVDQKELTRLVRRTTGKYVDLKTGRRPVLIPIVEIN